MTDKERPINVNPTATIYGCGGCGINVLNDYGGDDENVIKRLDTSFANIKKGQEITVLTRKAEGGGKIRKTNANEVDENIKALSSDFYSDVNILLYSSSGASGSLIGPLLNKYINSYNKKVINCVVVSDNSEIEITNSLNTIKSLDAIAKKDNIFMPIMIFRNTNKYTQREINIAIANHIKNIYDFMTIKVEEIDKADRLNSISDNDGGCGLRPMNLISNKFNNEILNDIITCNSFKNNNNEIVLLHSYMGIGHVTDKRVYPTPKFNDDEAFSISIKTKYEGIQVEDKTSSYISIVFPTDVLLKELVQSLETKLLKFKNLKANNNESIFENEDIGDLGDTGLVL